MATGQIDGSLSGKGSGKVVVRACIVLAALGAIFAFAFLRDCSGKASTGNVQVAKIGGRTFHLEVADTDAVRMKGMGQRTHIEDDGGMLFVFPTPKVSSFVMRDCPIPIDIIYLDQFGKVLAFYEMKPIAPRGPGEGQPGEVNESYEKRLSESKYDSRFPTQFVIEIKGGTLPSLKIKEGDKIDLPLQALKSRAQ